jgi:DNA-binding LacI/PurR family transcriptional regulator
MGKEATRILLRRIGERDQEPSHSVTLRPRLVVCGSTDPAFRGPTRLALPPSTP